MKFISQFVAAMLVAIFVPLVLAIVKKNSVKKEGAMDAQNFVISHGAGWPIAMLIISIMITLLFIAVNVGRESNLAANILVPVFILLFLFGAYTTARMKIVIKHETIIITPILGKTKHYCFHDITKIKKVSFSNGQMAYYVYGEKRLFTLDDTMAGTNLFLKRAGEFGIHVE